MRSSICTSSCDLKGRHLRRLFRCAEVSDFYLKLKNGLAGLATSNFESSLKLMSCMFVRNSEAKSHVTSISGPGKHPESWV